MDQAFAGVPVAGLILAVGAFWWVFPIIICLSMAGRKGKSPVLWLVLSIIFGWVAVLALASALPEDSSRP